MFMIELLPSPSAMVCKVLKTLGAKGGSPQNVQLAVLVGKILNSKNLGSRSGLAEVGGGSGDSNPTIPAVPRF